MPDPFPPPSTGPVPTSVAEAVFRVDGPLLVGTAAAYRVALLDRLNAASGLCVNLAAATEFDLFGLQLLAAARRSAVAAGRSFQLAETGAGFAEACERNGFPPAAFESVPRLP